MGSSSQNRDHPQAIRMTFQRLVEDEGRVQAQFGTFKGEFRVLGESAERVILGISDLERGQWGLKIGARLTLHLLDRGLPFEAVVDFLGHGKLQGVEACHASMPRTLRALDTHRLGDFVPERPLACPFSDQHNNVKDGHATAFGEDGLELAPPEGTRALGELLRLNATSTVELRAAVGESMVLPVRVAYFGEHVWGLRIADSADRSTLSRYRQWLMEARHRQAQRDLARFNPGGLEFSHHPSAQEGTKSHGAVPKLLVDRDPLILVLAEGDTFPTRLAEGIGRKFGVAALDLGPGALRPTLASLGAGEQGWGRVRLIMVHSRLRSGTSLERCRRLAQDEACPLPILMVGGEEEADLKRNRAASAGAVDYLVVEPFHVLTVLRTVDETLKLFG